MPGLRSLAVGAAGALTLAATLTAGPAHAVEPITDGTLSIEATVFAAGDCSGPDAPAPVDATITAGDSITRTSTLDITAASAADPTDTVALHATQRVSVTSKAAGGQLASVQISAATSGTATASKGAASNCTPEGSGAGWNMQGEVAGLVHRSTAGWAHLTVHSEGVGGQGALATLSTSGGAGLLESKTGAFGVRGVSDDQWVYAPAGDYALQTSIIGAATTYPKFPKAASTAGVTLTFLPAGVAKSAETGSAKPDVTFPSGLTCPSGKATVKLTSKVNSASKATLFVNGQQKKSITNPSAGNVTLTGLPTDLPVTLKAVVRQNGHSLSATRVYRAC